MPTGAACADADGLAFGIVHAPYLDETYLAVRGGGARLERKRAGQARDLEPRRAGTLDRTLGAGPGPWTGPSGVRCGAVALREHLVGAGEAARSTQTKARVDSELSS